MSERSIASYFNPPRGEKRKHEETEEKSKESETAKDVEEKSQDAMNERRAIIEFSQKNPALSSNIGLSWYRALKEEFTKDYFDALGKFIEKERRFNVIYPPEKDVYSWTNTCKLDEVKVVILGQDPYHGPNQAHGLAFSVRKGVAIPKSLINIYLELKSDISDFAKPSHGCLHGWATQGVLLLNTCLTVKARTADSHKSAGWEQFTDAVIKVISDNLSNVVFMLWGSNAKKKVDLIDSDKHLILTAVHPSPLSASRGFYGCRHFSKANEYLKQHGKATINWSYLP